MNSDDAYKRMAEKQQEANEEVIKAAAKDTNMCDNPRLATVPKELEDIFKKGVKLVDTLVQEGTLQCDEKCIYEKNKEKLKQNMEIAQRQYEMAPKHLRDSQEKYYRFTKENDGLSYEEFEKNEVQEILRNKINAYKKRFNEYVHLIKLIDAETNESKRNTMKKHLIHMQRIYKNDMHQKSSNIHLHKEANKVADRETFYYHDSIHYLRSMNIIAIGVYICLMLMYFFTFLYVYQEYNSGAFIKTRIFRILPFAVTCFITVSIYIYMSEQPLLQRYKTVQNNNNPDANRSKSESEPESIISPFKEKTQYQNPDTYIEQQQDIIKRQRDIIQHQKSLLSR